jgi:hypothetical protein
MTAPPTDVLLADGTHVPLRNLYESVPLALVFLRHYGCPFCRRQVGMLARHPELNVAFVAMGGPEETYDFAQVMQSPHRFIADPDLRLYTQFGLARAHLGQLFNLTTVREGLRAVRSGYAPGRVQGDPYLLGGLFVIDRSGHITFQHRAQSPAELYSPALIRQQIALPVEA